MTRFRRVWTSDDGARALDYDMETGLLWMKAPPSLTVTTFSGGEILAMAEAIKGACQHGLDWVCGTCFPVPKA